MERTCPYCGSKIFPYGPRDRWWACSDPICDAVHRKQLELLGDAIYREQQFELSQKKERMEKSEHARLLYDKKVYVADLPSQANKWVYVAETPYIQADKRVYVVNSIAEADEVVFVTQTFGNAQEIVEVVNPEALSTRWWNTLAHLENLTRRSW